MAEFPRMHRGSLVGRFAAAMLACGVVTLGAAWGAEAAEDAQGLQLTGARAGAPAVRKLRLHREGRVEAALGASFTLLDEYQRTIMPGLRVQYHLADWFAFGVWGGYGFQYTTGL